MDRFDANLDTYHRLNRSGNAYVESMSRRLKNATPEQVKELMKESDKHFERVGKVYESLGKEMAEIMRKPWWKFW